MALSKHTRTRLLWRGGKKVRAHRWLMEQKLGRKLLPNEHVHHKDGNPLNNDMGNLEVIECGPHMRLHKQIYPDQKQCVVCNSWFQVNPPDAEVKDADAQFAKYGPTGMEDVRAAEREACAQKVESLIKTKVGNLSPADRALREAATAIRARSKITKD